jgi:hypothetical protein
LKDILPIAEKIKTQLTARFAEEHEQYKVRLDHTPVIKSEICLDSQKETEIRRLAAEKFRREEAARKERELSDKLSALDTKNHKQQPFAARDNKNFIVPISPNTNDIVYPQDPDLPEDDSEFSLATDDPLSPPSKFQVPDRSLKPSKLEIPTGSVLIKIEVHVIIEKEISLV